MPEQSHPAPIGESSSKSGITDELIGFTTDALNAEVRRRGHANRSGKCDACGRWYDEAECNNLRHSDASEIWIGRWRLEWGSTWLSANLEGSPGRGTHLSISRYGVRVMLSRDNGSGQVYGCAETELPTNTMDDRAMFEWAITWATSWISEEDNS